MINTLFVLSAGITITFGILTLSIWSFQKSDRSYLFFSLVGIFSGINFLFAQPQFNEEFSFIYLFANVIYWSAFPFFIAEYTGYRRFPVPIICAMLLVLAYIGFVLKWPIWYDISHVSIVLMVGFCGFAIIKKKMIKKDILLLLTYLLFSFLAFEEILFVNLNLEIVPRMKYNFFPFDFYGLLFSLVIGTKLVSEINRKYLVEKELHKKEIQWGTLLENINLIVLILNQKGVVEYVNPYFEKVTSIGIADILGKNWFHFNSFDSEEVKQKKSLLSGDKSVSNTKQRMLTKSGDSRWIIWSEIPIKINNPDQNGLFSIGYDITEEENYLLQIQSLKNKLEKEKLELKEKLNSIESGHVEIIGESDAIQYAIGKARQVAGTNTSVLIEGETGVGKELFANIIYSQSSRKNKPFRKINCAAIPSELMESEFFGHEKGSFTSATYQKKGFFEMANGGTIFLDEVGEIPISLQAKLLRVLQNGEYSRVGGNKIMKSDVRIISATNKNLKKLVEKGSFREDLYYRLNVYPVTVPPLRSRKEDIPLLIRFFINKVSLRHNKKFDSLSKYDLKQLTEYNWPGNIRQLENIIERSIINSIEPTITIDMPENLSSEILNNFNVSSLEEMEKEFIQLTLENCSWKINGPDGAANRLNLNPNTLRSKMKKLNIERPVV